MKMSFLLLLLRWVFLVCIEYNVHLIILIFEYFKITMEKNKLIDEQIDSSCKKFMQMRSVRKENLVASKRGSLFRIIQLSIWATCYRHSSIATKYIEETVGVRIKAQRRRPKKKKNFVLN